MHIILLFSHCREAERKTDEVMIPEIVKKDTIGLENPLFASKYGINTESPPAWIGTDLVMEEVVEGVDQMLITIQGLNLIEFQKEGVEKLLHLQKNRQSVNYQDYTNQDKSLLFIKQSNNNISIQVDDIQKIKVRLDTILLNDLDISLYKKTFPGSYTFRNLYGISETVDLAALDSVETIDYTFLWALSEKNNPPQIKGRLDITWVNGKPYKVYFFSIP